MGCLRDVMITIGSHCGGDVFILPRDEEEVAKEIEEDHPIEDFDQTREQRKT